MQVNKYDRQIRLWGTSGQRRLCNAKVILIGCSGAGIQAIKNLVLPGVGHISIWDDRIVAVEDLSCSFFYAPEDVGSFRAEAAVRNLTEMNPDVKGEAFINSAKSIVQNKKKLQQYSLVICADLDDSLNHQISKLCWDLNMPVVFLSVIGFFVYVRNQYALHFVESQNTTSKKYYMRLHDPFEALSQHSKRWPIHKLIPQFEAEVQEAIKKNLLHQINYIPYPIILMQAYQSLQKKDRKKNQIIQVIKAWSIKLGEDHRDNFNEAAGRTFDLFQTADNFLEDISILEHAQLAKAKADSPSLIIFLRACSEFYKESGYLPQPTTLPDMHTSTQYYMQLKDTYRQQHQTDVSKLQQIIFRLFGSDCVVENAVISQYVNHLNSLKLVQLSPYFKQLESPNNPNLAWQSPEWRNILVAFRAYNRFKQRSSRVPTPSDYQQILALARGLCEQYGLQALDQRYLKQICRVEGKTTISINSIGGSLAGQQAIKLITHCFTPVCTGFIYEGIHSLGYPVRL